MSLTSKARTCKPTWVTGYNLRHALSVPSADRQNRVMAVLKKFRPRWWLNGRESPEIPRQTSIALVPPINARYDLRPLTLSQIDECWRLDQRCFVDGEAYSRDTFEYLLTAPRSEEHTSELQSHLNLVCRLLLEKKKRKKSM